MRVLLTGGSGQLGRDAAAELARRDIPFLAVTSREMDLRDEARVARVLAEYRPDAVLHCAAWTRVDRAEAEPEACMAVNARGTRCLAEGCRALGAKLLFVSTDYVFPGEGTRPYEVDDPTGPLNVYGRSKLAGEESVRALVERHFVVRTSWLMGRAGDNFVKTMLRLGRTPGELSVVGDQIGSPTFSADLARLYGKDGPFGRIEHFHPVCQVLREVPLDEESVYAVSVQAGTHGRHLIVVDHAYKGMQLRSPH